MKFLIFTDGGAYRPPNNNKTFDGFSAIRIHVKPSKDDPATLLKFVTMEKDKTMAYAELHAINVGLSIVLSHFNTLKENKEEIPKDASVKLFTDSLNCYMTLTNWIYGWIKKSGGIDKELKNSAGTVVKNQDEIKKTFKVLMALKDMGVNVKLFHVYSHLLENNTKQKKKKLTLDGFHKKFMAFNKHAVSKDEFMFILQENKACDEALTKYAKEFYIKQNQNKV